jgi:hypothetical protein
VSLRLAYRYQYGDLVSGLLAGTPRLAGTEHGAEFGVDYVRPLSATRRMTFSFGLGSGAANIPGTLSSPGYEYRALADASLTYQFRRSWEMRAGYRRGLEQIQELTEPVYTDGVTAAVAGFFTEKLDFAASVGYASGTPAVTRSGQAFDTYTASARLRRSLRRNVAVYLAYLYYFYDFTSVAQLQPGVPPSMERNGVRVGLTVWLPAVRR